MITSRLVSADHLEVELRGEHVGTLAGAKAHAVTCALSVAGRFHVPACAEVQDAAGAPLFSFTAGLPTRRSSVRVLQRPVPVRESYRKGECADPFERVRAALRRVDVPLNERRSAAGRRLYATLRESRIALHEISNLVALVGLCRPVRCDLVNEIMDAIERACGRTGGAA